MGRLHEVLAVEQTLEAKANKLLNESKKTLDKENLFTGQTRKLSHFSDEESHLDTDETVKLTTTVDENLEYAQVAVSEFWDANYQKESANQLAAADIVINGETIAHDVPATFLLGLEKKLISIRSLYESVHTLPPGREWVEDHQDRDGVFKTTSTEIQFKEVKKPKFITIAEATDHHPAQIVEKVETEKVGKYETTRKCGLWSPLKKAQVLDRLDQLVVAVKKARQRANSQEVENEKIADKLFDFING